MVDSLQSAKQIYLELAASLQSQFDGTYRKFFFFILRIRTIFLNIAEKKGFLYQDQIYHNNPGQNFYSKNYVSLLFERHKTNPKILEKVKEQILRDLDFNSSHTCQSSLIDRLSIDNTLICKALEVDLHDLCGLPKTKLEWLDLRVSRGYYRKMLQQNFLKDPTQKPKLARMKANQYKRERAPVEDKADFLGMINNVMQGLFEFLLPSYQDTGRQGIESYHQPRLIAFNCIVPQSKLGVIMVKPRRSPILTNKGQVISFAHCQYLEFVEATIPDKVKFRGTGAQYRYGRFDTPVRKYSWLDWGPTIKKITYEFKAQNRDNPNTFRCFDPQIVFQNLPNNQRVEAANSINGWFSVKVDPTTKMHQYTPIDFKDIPVPSEFQKQYQLMPKLNEWWCERELTELLKQDKFKHADNSIISKAADQEGGFQLLKLIKAIPNLKFQLTKEQELMISTPHNLLCLGRSGTGKTTSSALRLFATEAYYKFHDLHRKWKLENPTAKNSEFKVPTNFIQTRSDVKLLFVSASPVLVNEIKRFFIEFKSHFTTQLELRRKENKEVIEEQKDEFEDYIQMEIKELEQEEQIEKQEQLVPSMSMLSSDDFPLFLTVKRLLYMIDASTDFPFFARDSQGQMIGMDTNVQWHNESGGVLMINQYYKQTNELDQKLKTLGTKYMDFSADLETDLHQDNQINNQEVRKDEQKESFGLAGMMDTSSFTYSQNYARTGQNLSFEVDFEVFKLKFWPKVGQQIKLSPLVVWTEIFSEIKGRHDSWKYPFGGIDPEYYIRANRQKNAFLEVNERVQIYQVFLKYEKWKAQMQSYDINDLTNHILRQIKSSMIKESQQVHFLMVDEVQDLTQNTISLFMMLAEKNVFFSGDTAQTIAKGVGFRFFDLKQVFTRQNYESQTPFQVPKVLQLVKNFRSHARILDLANSVVSLLELLFPKTIDKLEKESSDFDGPRPLVLDHFNDSSQMKQLLQKYLLFGSEPTKKSKQGSFGCTQVVIVRDQEAKQYVPEFMKDILCLTVYEAKGLEFDDVILFNFFKDSKCHNQWNLLSDVQVHQYVSKIKKVDFLDFEHLECPDELKDDVETKAVEGETETTTFLKFDSNFQMVYRKFAQLCTELKLLYVAITRPKNFLLIIDQEVQTRKPILDYWIKTGVVDFISKQQTMQSLPAHLQKCLRLVDTPDLVQNEAHAKHQSNQIKQTWLLQGLKLFKVRYYRAAAQCFQNMGDQLLVKRCNAYELADSAAQIKGEHDQKLALVLDKKNNLTKPERQQLKAEAKESLQLFRDKMRQAGHLFCEIDMNQHAAQCFYSAGAIDFAAQMFVKQKKFGPAAECYFKQGSLKKAADLYEQANLFQNAFECYERLEEWDSLLLCLYKHKNKFDSKERESLLEKYLPVALNSCYQMYNLMSLEGQENLTEENRGKLQQMRLKLKFQKSVSVIKEENADEVESEKSDSENSEQDEKSQEEPAVEEESKDFVEVHDVEQQDEESFAIVEDVQNQSQQRVEDRQFELELLSNIDPEDEFLQSQKSFSLIESVSNNSSFSVIQSQQSNSEYSIISGSDIHAAVVSLHSFQSIAQSQNETIQLSGLDQNVQESLKSLGVGTMSVIEQGGNVDDNFGEEIVIQKIVYYISLFKEDVKASLKKTEISELEKVCDDQNEEDEHDFMLIELDTLSTEVIELVINTLEKYEMYRLCIMLATKFNLPERIGRFVSQICSKYSNLNSFRLLTHEKFSLQKDREAQMKYSMIAHEAVQNVLNLVAQQLQKVQGFQWMAKSFSTFFVLGYWRKLVFMMSSTQSIQLTHAMSDHQNLMLIFLVQVCGVKGEELKEFMNKPWSILTKINICQDQLSKDLIKQSIIEEGLKQKITKVGELICKQLEHCNCSQVSLQVKNLMELQTPCQFCQLPNQLENTWLVKRKRGQSFLQHLEKNQFDLTQTAYFIFKILNDRQLFQTSKSRMTRKQLYNQASFTKDLTLHALPLLHKALSADLTLKRAIYRAFGATLLDEIDLYSDFSHLYCLVQSDSPLQPYLMHIQDSVLNYLKVSIIVKELEKAFQQDSMGVNYSQTAQNIKSLLKTKLSQLSFLEQLDVKLALVCDLNLKHWLVPKEWVLEAIIRKCLDFAVSQVEPSEYPVKGVDSLIAKWSNSLCEKYLEKESWAEKIILKTQQITKNPQKPFQQDNVKQIFKQCFGKEFEMKTRPNSEIIKQVNFCFSQVTPLNNVVEEVSITVKPQYCEFGSKSPFFGDCLQLGISAFNSTLQTKPQNYPDQCYKIFNAFAKVDAVPVLLELLKNQKFIASKLKSIHHLIESHKLGKCLNLSESANHLTKFLNETFSTLSFPLFKDLVVQIFSQTWFSFQIYNSADGKIELTKQTAEAVSNSLIQNMPDLRCSVGNLKDVKNALIWAECFFNNLRGYEGWRQFEQLFKLGEEIVMTVLVAPLQADQLLILWPKLKLILQASLINESDSAKWEKMLSIVCNEQNWPKMMDIRKEILKKEKGIKFLSFSLNDRKAIQAKINQINLDVKTTESKAKICINEVLEKREKAALKITSIFKVLRQKKKLGEFKQPIVYINIEKRLKTDSNKDRLKLYEKLLKEQQKITQFVCSNIQHSPSNSQHCFDLLQKLASLNTEFTHSLAQQQPINTETVEQKLKENLPLFDQMLAKLGEEEKQTELDRKRFIKREKWDTVIQFHKKKRIMLKHFKSTLKQ